jgi:hypothetical protein
MGGAEEGELEVELWMVMFKRILDGGIWGEVARRHRFRCVHHRPVDSALYQYHLLDAFHLLEFLV